MVRVGFRPWLSFLLVAWGCVAVSFMFISSPWSFYLCRALLGVFESGAFPAMWWAASRGFGLCGGGVRWRGPCLAGMRLARGSEGVLVQEVERV
jgi:MFS family permease